MKKTLRHYAHRYFIIALNGMALGLFSSLIIGLIIAQVGKLLGVPALEQIAAVFGATSPVVGAAIGVGIAATLQAKPMVIFSTAAAGAVGYAYGGPVGAYLAGLIGTEIGGLVAQKTKVDILVTPFVTIVSGGLIALLIGPGIQEMMLWLGNVINQATELEPFWMGITLAVLVGMILTAPISSAAICIMLGLSGLAAGAATVGCCAQMVGFAVLSYKDNGWGTALSIGIGTSMLQFANILKRPMIWLPPIIASAILGPISTLVVQFTNIPAAAGMGTSGLVGVIGLYVDMSDTIPPLLLIGEIVVLCVLVPGFLSWGFGRIFYRLHWIRPGDLRLPEVSSLAQKK